MKTLIRWSRRAFASLTIASSIVAGAAPAAHAECLSGEVWYEIAVISGTRRYVIGPKACLVSTPWPVQQGSTQQVGPTGTRVGFGLWIPSPVAAPEVGVPTDCCPQ